MYARWRSAVGCLLAIAGLLIATTTAWAKELGALTISGPGIDGEITIDDPAAMRKLEESGFLDLSRRVRRPAEDLGSGYAMTLHLNLEEGPVPWMAWEYFPGVAGNRGYLHVVGPASERFENFEGADQWYRISGTAEAAFTELMAEQGVVIVAGEAVQTDVASAKGLNPEPEAEVAPAQVVSIGSSAPAETVTAMRAVLALGGASFALLAALGIVGWQRRRKASHSVTADG